MASISFKPITTPNANTSFIEGSAMELVDSQQKRTQEAVLPNLKRQRTDSQNSANKRVSPEVFKWNDQHQINAKKTSPETVGNSSDLNQYVTLQELSTHLNRKATADDLLNAHLDREYNQEINENDPEIPIRDLINWKIIKDFPGAITHLNNAVSWTALKNYLKKSPTPLQHLNCLYGAKPGQLNNFQKDISQVSTSCLINIVDNRNLTTIPSLQDVANYYGEKGVTIDLLKKYLGKELNDPLSFENFKKLFPNATWQEHLKCNRGMPLASDLTPKDMDEYMLTNKIHLLQGRINFCLERDLRHPISLNDIDNPYWSLVVNLSLKRPLLSFVSQSELEHVLNHKVTLRAYINCSWFRPISHPITRPELEAWLNRPTTLNEMINCREGKPLDLGQNASPHEHFKLVFGEDAQNGLDISLLNKYLDQKPTLKQLFNWLVNRNLETDLKAEHIALYLNKHPSEITQEELDSYNQS